MLGIYEHKKWLRYVPVLEVREEGVRVGRRIYRWNDIENVRRYRSRGDSGYGAVLFTDGARCHISLRTFRKKGEECRVSFLGENTTFEALKTYILQQYLQSLKDPRISRLEKEIDKLENALRGSDGSQDFKVIEKRLTKAIHEQIKLNNLYLETVTERMKKWG